MRKRYNILCLAQLIGSESRRGGSISYLRQKARAQKARKLGLSGLLSYIQYINFALLMRRIYVFFRVLNAGFHRGKKSGLMHVVAQGGGGKRSLFCRRMVVKAFHAHTHNMQESQEDTADSGGLHGLSGLPSEMFSGLRVITSF